MGRRHILWLQGELPILVSRGIIDTKTAEEIKDYYGEPGKRDYTRTMLTVFGTIGATLAGLGITLLIAFNWEGFPRGLKVTISVLPLLLSQALGIFVIQRKFIQPAWRETIALLLSFTAAAAIALVSQTYNIPGDLGNFLLTWMLLSLPLIYILESNAVTLLYLAGITAWSGYSQIEGGHAVFFWLLLALIIPRVVLEFRKNFYSNNSLYIAWVMVLCLTVATGVTLEKVMPGLWMIIYSAFFTCLYLVGSLWFRDAPGILHQPFQAAGVLGNIFLAYLFTYTWPWQEIGWNNIRHSIKFHHSVAFVDYTLTSLMIVAAVGLLVYAVYKRRKTNYILAVFPVLVVISYLLMALTSNSSYFHNREPVALLVIHLVMNLYLLGCGVLYIVQGTQRRKPALINGGTIMITILIALRFIFVEGFFENLIVRGLLFILLGSGFLLTNFFISRHYKRGSI